MTGLLSPRGSGSCGPYCGAWADGQATVCSSATHHTGMVHCALPLEASPKLAHVTYTARIKHPADLTLEAVGAAGTGPL